MKNPIMAHPQFHLQAGVLLAAVAKRPGAEEWLVRLADGAETRAIAYAVFGGNLAPGQRVWLNTTAVELGLGTGGVHFILSPLDDGSNITGLEIGAAPERAAGHLMKLRYTPLQHAVLAAEEAASPPPAESDLEGLPVVAAELHSAANGGRSFGINTVPRALPTSAPHAPVRPRISGRVASLMGAS